MHVYPLISPHAPPHLTPCQSLLTEWYQTSTFKYRLANAGGDMFKASIHFDAMGELERLFLETMKGAYNGLPQISLN